METSKTNISFLITHYNRPIDLLKCLQAIKSLNVLDSEIIVCDDGSIEEHFITIQNYDIDVLIGSNKNQGLAANINKGIKACKGEYIIYCQEDFLLAKDLSIVLLECIDLLHKEKVDMIRFTSNSVFRKLIPLSEKVSLIPKFSFQNILHNYYQYSDHPFVTKNNFYNKYGDYLEGTSGRYGETEYAIRILKSNARIGLTNQTLVSEIDGSHSVLVNESMAANREWNLNKKWIKIARAFRLYLELILYNTSKRGLITYKNFRK